MHVGLSAAARVNHITLRRAGRDSPSAVLQTASLPLITYGRKTEKRAEKRDLGVN